MARAPPEPPIRRYRGLTVAEWLTASVGLGSVVIGVGSLAVAWLTYENGKDTRDLKRAIASLTTLAEQTKRQADNSAGQLAVLRDQVGEAKKQTAAISKQTTAIKASSDANVKSADAQKRAADIGASAAKATVALTGLELTGFTGELVEGFVKVNAKPSFTNVGGSTLSTGATSFILAFGELPAVPRYDGAPLFGEGNEVTVTPHTGFSPTEPFVFRFSPEVAKAVASGQLQVFIYGVANYVDAAMVPGRYCYAFRVTMKDGNAVAFKPAGGPAYHCVQQSPSI